MASWWRMPSAWTVLSLTVTLVLVSLTRVPPSEARIVLKPDDVALVLRGGDADDVGLALGLQLLADGHDLGPGLGRRRHQRLAVPEQLHVGAARDGVELVLPGRRVDRRLEDSRGCLFLLLAGELADPAGLGELGRPGDVHAQDVHAVVVRGEPADELLTLAVGIARDQVRDDLVLASRGLVAVVEDLVETYVRGAAVDVDRRWPTLAAAGHERAAGDHTRPDQRRQLSDPACCRCSHALLSPPTRTGPVGDVSHICD